MRRPITTTLGLLAVWMSLTAGVCQTTRPPEVRTVEVHVPVAVPCDPDVGPDPNYPDTDQALREAAGLFDRVKLLLAGRELRRAREKVLKAGLNGCAKVRTPPAP